MRRNVMVAVLLVATGLVGVRYAFAGQAPAAASDPDIPISHQDRVYSAEQYSNTVSVTDPVDNKLLGTIRLGDPLPEKARSANPAHPLYRAHLASAYALKGEIERAAAELADARRLTADSRYSSIAYLTAAQYLGVPKIRALLESTYFAGLRKAGMPEE